MKEIGTLHMHIFVVSIFVAFFLLKTLLLLANRRQLLGKIRAKTRILEMAVGAIIIVTGVYLAVITKNKEAYLWAKVVLVMVSIPVGIVAMKKQNKAMAVLSLLLFLYIYGIAESKSPVFKRPKFPVTHDEKAGEEIYTRLCIQCHGTDGKKGLFKSPDLTKSTLGRNEKIERVSHGKGVMRSYKDELTHAQIEAVIDYTERLQDD